MARKRLGLLPALIMVIALLTGCGADRTAREEADTITVYLWTSAMLERFAPYIQAQLPDVNIQFVVGNNDLDFYRFMDEHGALPDIITCCRFSLHDAAPLKDSLMDLSTTTEAGSIYDSYLSSFTNEDGSVNWLPLSADVHGFVANRGLFEQHGIPLPTDYESFVAACQAFEALGIRGCIGDYVYDYTCMEALQGLSIPELTSAEGRQWRTAYSDPASTERVGLDDAVWPGVFVRMERFIQDTRLGPDDLKLDYTPVINMYARGEAAMITGSSARVLEFLNQGIDTVLLPYFGQNGEAWLMTTPYLQVALSRNLQENEARREKAMQVLRVMLSEGGQTVLSAGQDVLTYSRNVGIHLTGHLSNLRPLIEQNHMYIRIASNDFFAISKDVVSRMIAGEYNAQQAYEAFDAQLRAPEQPSGETVLSSNKTYSAVFHTRGGSEAYSVMAHTLRGIYGSDVLVATGDSFTGCVLEADYTATMAGNMVMPNALVSFHREMTGAELKDILRGFVEGVEGGFVPFNRGSLPVVSGVSIEVRESKGAFTLTKVRKDGKEVRDDETFSVTCLATAAHFAPFRKDESHAFTPGEDRVKDVWLRYVSAGNAILAQPEAYITLK